MKGPFIFRLMDENTDFSAFSVDMSQKCG